MTWLLYIFSFAAGLGINMPFVNLYQNFGIFDVIILFLLPISLFSFAKISASREGKILGLFIALLVFWEMLSLLMAPIKGIENIGPIVRLAYYGIIVFVVMGAIREEKHLRMMVYLFLLGTLVNLIGSIYLWALAPRYWFHLPMFSNEFVNRNVFYYYLVFALPFAIGLARITQKKVARFFSYLWSVIITIAAFLSFSKGAWIILGIVWGGYGILCMYKILVPLLAKGVLRMYKNLTLLLVMGLIVIGLFGTGIVQIENIQKEVKARLTPDALAPSLLRIDFFRISWEIGLDHFLFGVGVRNFRHFVSDYHEWIITRDPHNTYAMVFAETGFPGLVFYLAILGSVFWWFLKSRKRVRQDVLLQAHWESGMLLIIVVFILNIVTGISFTDKIFPFFLLYITGIVQVARLRKSKNKSVFFL